jgi:acyl-CoA reductase-like NAD-dependent aldehyde dehydrogenase
VSQHALAGDGRPRRRSPAGTRPAIAAASGIAAGERARGTSWRCRTSIFGEPEQAAAIGRRLAAGRVMINEGPLYSGYALPIGGIRDGGLYGSTDKIEEMAYTKRLQLAT